MSTAATTNTAFRIPLHGRTVWYFFGGLTLFCLALLAVTGMLLSAYYVPSAAVARSADGQPLAVWLGESTGEYSLWLDTVAHDLPEGRVPLMNEGTDKPLRANIAWRSVQRISRDVPFGGFIRALHTIAAYTLFCTLLIHLFGALFLVAWRNGRSPTWYTGIALLLLVFASGFTGYILPWDYQAYFSASVVLSYIENYLPLIGPVVATALRGGTAVGADTLNRMSALHTSVLPVFIAALVAWHLVQVRLRGLSESPGRDLSAWILLATLPLVWMPYFALASLALAIAVGVAYITNAVAPPAYSRPADASSVGHAPYGSHYVYRDLLAWLLLAACLVTVVLVVRPEIVSMVPGVDAGVPADVSSPMTLDVELRPPWYYLFAWQLLNMLPGHLAMALLLGSVAALCVLPVIDRPPYTESRKRLVQSIGIVLLLGFIGLTIWGYLQ